MKSNPEPTPAEAETCEKCGKSEAEIKTFQKTPDEEYDTTPYMTVGEYFDRLKKKGYKTMPKNIEINAGQWKSNNKTKKHEKK